MTNRPRVVRFDGPTRPPRRTRSDGPQPPGTALACWIATVRSAETRGLELDPFAACCPGCNGDQGLEARDQLEAVIRRGGRRGRRVGAAVRPWDDRFERATLPGILATGLPAARSSWWWYREVR